MNLVILTTETPHHVFFAREILKRHPIASILAETRHAVAPFETAHPFEAQRDDHERQALLAGGPQRLAEIAKTEFVASMNDSASVAALRALDPDVVMVFGTGKLSAEVIHAAPLVLNLHGGNPEHYRGLDTHLWAIYHNDFDNLVTTLQIPHEELDCGEIVFQGQIRPYRGMELYELRAANTRLCIELASLALRMVEQGQPLPSRRLAQKGRYYSFMPSVLKQVCLDRWRRYVRSL